MSEKQAYLPTDATIEWVAGYRVQHDQDGKVLPIPLSDAEAAPELARGRIALAPAGKKAKDAATAVQG